MSEAARSRRDDVRFEPQLAVPGRDGAAQGSSDPLAELARLVGHEDPFRGVFRPAPAPLDPGAVPDDGGPHYASDVPHPNAAELHGDEGYAHDDAHGAAEGHDGHVYGDGHAAHDASHPDAHGYGYDDDAHAAYDDRYDAAVQEAHPDEAGFADEHFATDQAAAATLPDMWARAEDGSPEVAQPFGHGDVPPRLGSGRAGSARRPLAVLAAVLVLTGGGLAASFLAKGPATPGVAAANSGRSAPTIMAASGPTKVKVEDGSATAPEDQDAALLNKNGNVSSGPVKIVSSQEQPADLGQLPKATDLADGARPLPAASPSPFPEPKKVKTFVVHPDGTMLSADGAPSAPDGTGTAGPASPDALGSALPATPRTATRGGATPKSAPPAVTIAALSADPALADAGAAAPRPPRQPAAPGVRAASAKPNDTADAPGAAGGSYGVQLASSPVEADANAAFAKLKKKYPSQLGSLTATVHKAETGDKPVYRVRVGSMGQDEAKALCSQLQGAGGSCFVVHN